LLVAFFTWASAHRHPIDVCAWAPRIAFDEFDALTVSAVASLLQHLDAPLAAAPPAVLRLIDAAFAHFRLPFTDAAVLRLLRSQRGVGWLLARNVVRLDRARWAALAPLAVAAALGDAALFAAHVADPDQCAVFSAAAAILAAPDPRELRLLDPALPPAFPFPPQLLSFAADPFLPAPRAAPAALLDAVIAALAPRAPVPWFWFPLFAAAAADPASQARARGLFSFADPAIARRFPTLFACEAPDADAARFFHGMPPSFSRAFVRGRRCALLPPARVSAEASHAIGGMLRPVFPGLAYVQGAPSGVPAHICATPLSALLYGIYSPAFGPRLLRTLACRSSEALSVCAALLQLPLELLHTALPQVTKEMAREEVMKRLLESATGGEASVAFAARAIDCVLAWATPEQVMVIVGNAEFLTRPGFACVATVFRAFKEKVERDGPPAVAEWCRVLTTDEAGIFADEFKKRVFADLANPVNIADTLHRNVFPEK
jgi:hypothetical protein